MSSSFRPVTRREAIKTTLLFSSAMLLGDRGNSLLAAEPEKIADPQNGIHLFSFGDFGTKNDAQLEVATAMKQYAAKIGAPLSAVLALGDNFYGNLTPETIKPRFSNYYPKESLNCPFYALLGNHDYGPQYDSKQGPAKAAMQLAYAAQNPGSRWKMPAKWYAFELGPKEQPMVKIIYLDGNYFEGALTPQEKLDQRRWLQEEMAKPTKATWLWIASHYPIFSDSTVNREKERAALLREWEPYLRNPKVSLYLAGHDHNLQHLQIEGFSPDFIVSGGGGASRYDIKQDPRGFAMKTRGFNHLHVTREKFTVRYLNPEGKLVHAFERGTKGPSKVLPV